ncbi:2OG-Fe(II) oxygenase [Phenylobacterium hankyongense]|uniref:2OG-Fe(II) oxygenase n=1 Tax=Phenylobacterium hankyongense TaxID=1813876 RepID=A0A328AZZ7_9CAUL|nr:2OG-Fe(II) oxygenase [Phenylobacterium hankyongense]RAK58358.1 2OG-Fe(II) oxygenase [Phenylobacterium hankyongense]
MSLASPQIAVAAEVAQSIRSSLARAAYRDRPFPNWRLDRLLPEAVARQLAALPFTAPDLGGISGRRELHNPTRRYFAGQVLDEVPQARAVAEAFQSAAVLRAVMMLTGALLVGSFLRIEYALDVDGFWLEPHTDLGVKTFTLLFQFGGAGQEGLGTDLYLGPGAWTERIPFGWNTAIAFVPSDRTWHGFEPRTIEGVRRSMIVNFVTDAWRAREELAFPDRPAALD